MPSCPCHALMPLSCPHAPVMPSYPRYALTPVCRPTVPLPNTGIANLLPSLCPSPPLCPVPSPEPCPSSALEAKKTRTRLKIALTFPFSQHTILIYPYGDIMSETQQNIC